MFCAGIRTRRRFRRPCCAPTASCPTGSGGRLPRPRSGVQLNGLWFSRGIMYVCSTLPRRPRALLRDRRAAFPAGRRTSWSTCPEGRQESRSDAGRVGGSRFQARTLRAHRRRRVPELAQGLQGNRQGQLAGLDGLTRSSCRPRGGARTPWIDGGVVLSRSSEPWRCRPRVRDGEHARRPVRAMPSIEAIQPSPPSPSARSRPHAWPSALELGGVGRSAASPSAGRRRG